MSGTYKSEKINRINSDHIDPALIEKAAQVIRRGGVVCFPTRCLYGLGADAFDRNAVERVYEIKKRSQAKPLLVLIPDRDVLPAIAQEISPAAVRIMDKFWPGKVSLVFKAQKRVPDNLTAMTAKIGVRLPEHPVAAALVEKVGHPITGTSANLSGQPGCSGIEDLAAEVLECVDMVLDAGPLKGGIGSTLVDVTLTPPVVLREGEVSATYINRLM